MAQITFRGEPLDLSGSPPQPGESARDFTTHRFAPDEGMVEMTLADLPRKPLLLNVVPSLDTPVCSLQTRSFNEKLASYGEAVASYTVSVDLPFAQYRFCGDEGVENMTSLSDYRSRSFGASWGMLIPEIQLLARGVFVLDAAGVVRYAEVVPEIADEPRYEDALRALDEILAE